MTLPIYAMNTASFPEMYERYLVGGLFRPWAEILLERVHLADGDRVLDIACGTGIVARLAKERLGDTGRVVGIDVSPQMLEVARAANAAVDWREGNASALPIGDAETFDIVACQQGLQFFSDKAAAAREMRRALAPGGRLAVAVWLSLEDNPLFYDLHRVGERHLGSIVDARYSLGAAASLEQLLAGAGFNDVRVEAMFRPLHIPDGATFLRMNTMALVGMSSAAATLSAEDRARLVDVIVNDSTAALAPYMKGAAAVFESGTNIATARG